MNYLSMEKMLVFEIADLFFNTDLDTQLYRNSKNLVEVIFFTEKTLQLKILFFFGQALNLSTVKVGIQDALFNYARHKMKVKNIENLSKLLIDDCVINTQTDSYICVLLAHQESLQTLEKKEQEEERGNEILLSVEENSNDISFTIIGKKYRLQLLLKKLLIHQFLILLQKFLQKINSF